MHNLTASTRPWNSRNMVSSSSENLILKSFLPFDYRQLFSKVQRLLVFQGTCVSSRFLFGQDTLSRLSVAYVLRSLALTWSFSTALRQGLESQLGLP